MDGVGQYVTVRRDFFAATSLVASAATLPVTLAPPNTSPTVATANEQQAKVVNLNQYDCNLCSKSFSSKSLLTRHLKNHHSIATIAATSSNSPTAASSSSSPPSAAVVGSDGQALILRCEQDGCNGRTFSSQISLVKHIKSVHEGMHTCASPTASANSSDGSSSSESQQVKRLNEKRFQCLLCNKRFPTSKDLKRHDVVHTGNREFQCSFCSHRFGRKDHRMRHEKKTHANEYQLSSSPISPSATVASSNITVSEKQQQQQQRPRWRHVSSPSVSTASPTSSTGGQDIEMTDLPVRIRAMSTSSSILQQPPQPALPSRRTTTDAPLYDETSLKYLESQLSPESLLMEDTSEDDSAASAAVSWIMSEFMIKKEPPVDEQSPASPPETPDPSSLSPPVLYPVELQVPTPTKHSRCDVLTRTKNPVLPSVYIDNSLIVPEPSKHKYHSNPSPTLLGNGEDLDDVDLDYFEAFMDDKETVNLFPV